MTRVALRALACAWVLVVSGACGDGGAPPPVPPRTPVILEIASATPVVDGSAVVVTGVDLDAAGTDPTLIVSGEGARTVALPRVDSDGAESTFRITSDLVSAFGAGRHAVQVVYSGPDAESAPTSHDLDVSLGLDVQLDSVPGGPVHRNELAVLTGSGFLAEGEGIVEAVFEGTFTPDDGGAPTRVDARAPVRPAERFDRDRGLVSLTTDIGGLRPGTFEGDVRLTSSSAGGHRSDSVARPTSLSFGPPLLLSADPPAVSLEQYVRVRGAGFLGGPDRPDEVTLIRLQGTFDGGGGPTPFGPRELVLGFVSGTEMLGVLRSEAREGFLVSELFGDRRGSFSGRATLVVVKGVEELEAAPVDFTLGIAPLRQVVQLRFLPSFYDTLVDFGLAASAGVVEGLVRERIESIYGAFNIDVRLDEVDDFSPNGFAVVEIAGTDPNGVGLFGYDNTPGKDIGNLRLADKIGGTNAETQADGYPGYGGVFIESFLYFSSHPGLPGEMPFGRPEPEALFDEIFDPVRSAPATLAEVRAEGSGARIEQVQRALLALASIIGETAAHELGHSLGLADPYGPPTVFHNGIPGEGCLMDSGSDRPFGERAAQPGFQPTRLCNDAPGYLAEILGR